MIFLRVGWAKPVPVNPRNFRHYRRDYIIVSLAGIVTNLLICILSLIISAILAKFIWGKEIVSQMGDKALLINIYEGFLPYYVYSGELKALADYAQIPWLMYVQRLFLMLAQMNLGLAIFNLLPVPPLDGFRFMDQFVFKGRLALSAQTMQTIHVVFLVICMSGALSGVLSAANSAVMGALTSVISLII
jgi:Zn-dependent protease